MLAAAAAGEDALDQGGDGHHVLDHEGLQLHAQAHVLNGRFEQAAPHVFHVLVEARHIVDRVLVDLRAVVAETGDGVGDLFGAVFLPVGRVHGDVPVEGEVRGAEELRQLAASGAAQHVEQEQAVGGGDVAGAEQGVGAAVAEDMRHAEAVALDRHAAVARRHRDLAFPVAGVRCQQRRLLEVVAELAVGEAFGTAHQGVVQVQLVVEVRLLAERRHQAGFRHQVIEQRTDQVGEAGNVGGQVAQAAVVVLPGRQDVEHPSVVGERRADLGRALFGQGRPGGLLGLRLRWRRRVIGAGVAAAVAAASATAGAEKKGQQRAEYQSMNHTASRLLFYGRVQGFDPTLARWCISWEAKLQKAANCYLRLRSNGFHIDSVQWRV